MVNKKQVIKELQDEIQHSKKENNNSDEPLLMDATMSGIKKLITDIINNNIFISKISISIPQGYFPQVFDILKDYQDLLIYNNISWEIKREKGQGFDLIIKNI